MTFTIECGNGPVPQAATVTAAFLGAAGAPTPAAVPLRFDVTPAPRSPWPVLWWFLAAVPVAVLAVVVPYLFWCRSPAGNAVPGVPAPPAMDWRAIGRPLPHITTDWNLKDNWSSNIGLAAALFTTVIADADPLRQILGADSAGPLAVVTVAAALSAALIGTGPLWLVICKRRYRDNPTARHHTVAGILVAAFVVLCAGFGLVLTVAVVVQRPAAWLLACAAVGLMVAYAAKSIPMTLARGALGDARTDAAVSGML